MLEKWMLLCMLIGFVMSLPLAWGADAVNFTDAGLWNRSNVLPPATQPAGKK